MKQILVLGAVLALCGCAVQGRDERLASKSALKACLAQHAQDAKACDSVLVAFQADLAVYQPTASTVAIPAQAQTPAPQAVQQQNNFASFGAR